MPHLEVQHYWILYQIQPLYGSYKQTHSPTPEED